MLKISEIRKSKNVAELLKGEELSKIGAKVIAGYDLDDESRAEWMDTIDKALDIAKQVIETKNTPWPGASNIKFPLITKGSIDFAARLLPELIRNDSVVKISVVGEDPQNIKMNRAERVKSHMTYQLLKQSDDWEENMDKLLHVLPILGTVFKKTYYDPIERAPMSELCLPHKIVVNHNIHSLKKARRISHKFTCYANDIVERIRAGLYCDCDVDKLKVSEGHEAEEYDPPIDLIEQHCYLDLDEDGYEEPYVVIVHKLSGQVLRIVPRFKNIRKNQKGEILRIEPEHYFIDYHFLKSPDGGFYSLGLGTLIYPLNETINTLFNQLVDSGTLANQQSGFIGRGLRLRNGEFRMKLGEWKVVDAAGGMNIAQNVFPLPSKEPSQTLFQLLGLLIETGKDLLSINDVMAGKQPAQNVPATTILTLVEQGMKVYNAVTKRIFRALRNELRRLFDINREYLPNEEYKKILDNPLVDIKKDYETESFDIIPIADPAMASDAQRLAKAQALMGIPGLDPKAVTEYYLEALQIEKPLREKLLPPPDPNAPPPPDIVKMLAETKKLEADAQRAMVEAQVMSEKNVFEARRIDLQQADTEARARESEARITKMKQDAVNNTAKVALAGAKSDFDAEMAKMDALYKREFDEANLSIQTMKEMREAAKLRVDASKEDRSSGNRPK